MASSAYNVSIVVFWCRWAEMFLSSLAIVLCVPALVLAQLFNLSELNWTLRNQNGSIVVPGSVPSQVHLDLVKAGIITEPLLGANGTRLTFLEHP